MRLRSVRSDIYCDDYLEMQQLIANVNTALDLGKALHHALRQFSRGQCNGKPQTLDLRNLKS
jgi:hypothetical protein